MELVNGDYVSKLWLNESAEWAWTLIAILRASTAQWEVILTCDRISEPGAMVKCDTIAHKVVLPISYSEVQICDYVESIINACELAGKSQRVATIPVHSANPQVFIDRFYETAQQNDKIACSFVHKEVSSPPSPQV